MSTVAAICGEKNVLRILGQQLMRDVPALEELDMSQAVLERVNEVIATPNGVFFVTGPTGCGKSTTMFSVLRQINRPGINIVTVEDQIRRLIGDKAPMQEVCAAAARAGYMGLRYDGLKKVLRGLTTLEEVDRIAPAR